MVFGNFFMLIDLCEAILIMSDMVGVIQKTASTNIPEANKLNSDNATARPEGNSFFNEIPSRASTDAGKVAAISIGPSVV
jgi:hypothetical protein